MIDSRSVWISSRAYHLWEQAGRPLGQDDKHWSQAVFERELLEQTQASPDGREVLERTRELQVSSRSVLVVDDETWLRFNIVDFLDQAGYHTLEAVNADEALALLKHTEIDTLYTDIDMPGSMDGLGLARHVRFNWPNTRIIVTSGLVSLSQRDVGNEMTFVSKPTAKIELLKLMAQ